MTTTVLLVDDEPLVRSGLRAVLASAEGIEVVGEAGDGAEVPAAVARLSPTVVLMDVRMPRIDGISATQRLMASPQPPKVLVVTTFENDEYVYAALRAGASGFVLKRAQPEQIVAAVRTVASGESLLFPTAIRSLARAYGRSSESTPAQRLSGREQDVLRLMARGLTNAEIATEMFVGIETVKTHVSAVLGKLGVRDRTQAVILAYESGFLSPRLP
ncbi:DNA-binding response regulator [Terrabacter tumescens]|uniref:DNA-binding response regulator n=1 Tax=Terrabacter tumescens TaxID=60443 RepID=A0ABQ2IFZ1_9MICO|nr:response regulator transcription factor [Terrabacter tumescens]GGN07251.1 DNA-binding response regulator [Terrabacter tumescens]